MSITCRSRRLSVWSSFGDAFVTVLIFQQTPAAVKREFATPGFSGGNLPGGSGVQRSRSTGGSMKTVRLAALALVVSLPGGLALAQPSALAGGVGFGGPLGASAMGELLYGMKADIDDDGNRVLGVAGLLVQVQAGTGGGKLSLGVGGDARIRSDDFKGVAAAGLKLSLARTWGSPLGTEPGLTYLGPELDLSAMHVALTLGPLFRVGGEGGSAVLFSFGVGLRF
jgi:hypothetical protein